MNHVERGVVYLVGAGPGAADLITVRGREILRQADVVVYDRLIDARLLDDAPQNAVRIDAGKVPGGHGLKQSEINALLIEHAKKGRAVVRLKGGDPFVFGRGMEEWLACREVDIPCVVIPGVTSAFAAPLAAGIPVTHRDVARSVAVITGRTACVQEAAPHHGAASQDGAAFFPPPAKGGPGGVFGMQEPLPIAAATPSHDWPALAKIDTLVIMMGRENLRSATTALLQAGKPTDTPAACIASGTTANQRAVFGTLGDIADRADAAGLKAPVVTVVGEVVRFAKPRPSLAAHEALASILRPERGVLASGTACPERPLAGRRMVLTGTASTNRRLSRLLRRAGTAVIECPLIQITYPDKTPELDSAIENLREYDWLLFASGHGVRGFWRRLGTLGRDARSLACCQVAAIGSATACALRRRGITPDLIPNPHTGAALVDALSREPAIEDARILRIAGNLAIGDLAKDLGRLGATVEEVIAYENAPAAPPDSAVREIEAGVDAVLLCSPSAVRQFLVSSLPVSSFLAVACIGPTTAAAAQNAGLGVSVVAPDHTAEGLVATLIQHFNSSGDTP